MNDPQLRVYLETPHRYATIAAQVDVVERISDRPCAARGDSGDDIDGEPPRGECDEGRACWRHSRQYATAVRYVRLRENGYLLRWVGPEVGR